MKRSGRGHSTKRRCFWRPQVSIGCRRCSRSGSLTVCGAVSCWPSPGTMLILRVGPFGYGGRSGDWGVRVWCSGRRSRPDRVGASRYRSPRARRCCHTGWAGDGAAGRGGVVAGLGPGLHNFRGHGCGAAKSVQDLRAAVQRSGVRRIRFHDLRHACASLLLAQGVSPRVVMDVLGHSQLAITMDLYSHVMPSALRDAADAMDRALSPGR